MAIDDTQVDDNNNTGDKILMVMEILIEIIMLMIV